jgi:tRNA (cmo5U34)-methyltransferase
MSSSTKEWSSPQHAVAYLNVADSLPHRSEGESVLIDHLPYRRWKVNQADKGGEAVALDVSPIMLKSVRPFSWRFEG